jgi:DNA polymerase-3 subunit alpha (Gram-positive type)
MNPWRQVLNECGLNGRTRERLESFEIRRIFISRDESFWDVYFHCPFAVAPDEEALVQEIWTGVSGSQIRGRFYFVKPRSHEDLETVCSGEKQGIMDRLDEELPSASAWLTESCWRVNRRQVTIGLKKEMGLDYLREHQAHKILEGIFKLHYGLDAAVAFLLEPEGEGWQEALERLDQKDLESVSRTVRKPAAEDAEKPKNPLILGREIKAAATALEAVTDEERSITVKGQIFQMEEPRRTKNDTWILTFSMTDLTNSIS